MYTFLINL